MNRAIVVVLLSALGAACGFPPPPPWPDVTETVPADQATDVDAAVEVLAMFSAELDEATITADTFQVTLDGAPVDGVVTYDPDTLTARWRPADTLALLATYEARLDASIASPQGRSLGDDGRWTFTVRDGAWSEASAITGAPMGGFVDPDIAVDPAGDALVVWNPSDLWARRLTTSVGWEDPVRIDDQEADARHPRIAIGADGAAVAVWSQATAPSGLSSAFANRYLPGTGWGEPVELEVRSAGVIDPMVAAAANGGAVAIWIQHRDDGMGQQVIANRFSNDWEGAQSIGETGTYQAAWPSVAFDGRGDAIAVWRQAVDGSTSAWANRLTTGWTGPRRLETLDGEVSFPQVAGDQDGNAIAVWGLRDADSAFHLRSSRFTPGSDWSTATDLDAGFDPKIAITPDGEATVTYLKGEIPNMSIWTLRYRPSDGWGEPEPISSAGGVASHVLVVDHRANAVAVWSRNDGPDQPVSLWVSRYTRAAGWSDPWRLDAGDADAALPRAAVDARGRVTIVWQHGVFETRLTRFE